MVLRYHQTCSLYWWATKLYLQSLFHLCIKKWQMLLHSRAIYVTEYWVMLPRWSKAAYYLCSATPNTYKLPLPWIWVPVIIFTDIIPLCFILSLTVPYPETVFSDSFLETFLKTTQLQNDLAQKLCKDFVRNVPNYPS